MLQGRGRTRMVDDEEGGHRRSATRVRWASRLRKVRDVRWDAQGSQEVKELARDDIRIARGRVSLDPEL